MHSYPDAFLSRIATLLGDETGVFLEALSAPEAGLRVNTLRLSPEVALRLLPFELESLGFVPEGFVVGGGARPGAHPYHAAGLYYIQDPGAMVVGSIAAPAPGDRVIDLAAAPGGKTTHLAARMQNRGILIANDVHPTRARELAGNLERLGVVNAIVTSSPVKALADRFGDRFDRVLLDAPCSGESMFHKSEAAIADWSEAAVIGCARRQEELLHDAARLVRPGGALVYSTCTFAPEENEIVIARFLAEHGEFSVAAVDAPEGSAPGMVDQVPGALARPDIANCVRLWPHRVKGAGHFIAVLERRGWGRAAPGGEAGSMGLARDPAPGVSAHHESGGGGGGHRSGSARGIAGRGKGCDDGLPAARAAWVEFAARHGVSVRGDEEGEYSLVGESLYRSPVGAPELRGVRIISRGLRLGTYRKGRFDPSHSLAMAADPASVANVTALRTGDPEVASYLRGETLDIDGPNGWTLVTVGGFALGWGKRTGGVVKNHYPKGLRARG